MNRRFDDYGFGKVLRLSPALVGIITALLTIGVAWGVVKTRLEKNQEDIRQTQIDVDRHSIEIAKLQEIVAMLPEMRNDIKKLMEHEGITSRRR